MKLLAVMSMLGGLASGSALALDYSVGITNIGSGALGGGTAINLYATKNAGIDLVQTYVLQQDDFTGKLASPLILAINPAHDFVYVVYTGVSVPNIVGFEIASTGLVKKWEAPVATGDVGLQGSNITAGPNYVIENTYPAGSLWVYVVGQSGVDLLLDNQSESSSVFAVSGQVDSTRTLYYSCRAASSSLPATSVSAYKFESGVYVFTATASPVATSTDPVYVQSICD